MSSMYDAKSLESIPPALLRITPAGNPPSGIQPAFADPPTRVPVILGVSITFAVLAILCFSIRIYTKLFIVKNWRWDDLTCSLGFMSSIVYLVAEVIGCINGPTGRHVWDVYLDKILNKSNLYQSYITTVTVTPALGLIKFSLFIQYYLLFRPLPWVRISVWIGATISAAFYISVTIASFVMNSPWPGESLLEGLLSWHFQKFSRISIATGVISIVVDWYLLILPIPAVWTLQMSISKRLGVLAIFMTGGLAAIASIMSMYYRVLLEQKNHLSDSPWNVSYVLLWPQIEMFAGVTASSMPAVHQFFTRPNFSLASWWSSLISSLRRSSNNDAQIKLSEYNPSFKDRDGKSMHAFKDRGRNRTKDLESDGCEREALKAPRTGKSQIHLTHDISITQEQLDQAWLSPVITDRQW